MRLLVVVLVLLLVSVATPVLQALGLHNGQKLVVWT